MAYYGTINGEILEDIADAIRELLDVETQYPPSEMADVIRNNLQAKETSE